MRECSALTSLGVHSESGVCLLGFSTDGLDVVNVLLKVHRLLHKVTGLKNLCSTKPDLLREVQSSKPESVHQIGESPSEASWANLMALLQVLLASHSFSCCLEVIYMKSS